MSTIKTIRVNIALNKSITYLLPLIATKVNFKFLQLLKNSYLYEDDGKMIIGVLYKFKGKPHYTKYEKELMENELFLGHEDFNEYVLYKFKIPEEYNDEVKLFINGKYSMLDIETKRAIESFIKKRDNKNLLNIVHVLKRDESLRKRLEGNLGCKIDPNDELSSPPNMELEDIKNNIEYIEHTVDTECF